MSPPTATPADRLVEKLKALGFQPHADKPGLWFRSEDPSGPGWYCVTVDTRAADVCVCGTRTGYPTGQRLADELRPLLRKAR